MPKYHWNQISMNKNYLFAGIGAVSIVIILSVVLSVLGASINLDQILANKDCAALEKWEAEYIYDENLNLTNEQKKKIMSVGLGCVGKAMNNVFGNSDSSSTVSDNIEENKEAIMIFDEIIETKFCKGLEEWKEIHGKSPDFLSDEQKKDDFRLEISCTERITGEGVVNEDGYFIPSEDDS